MSVQHGNLDQRAATPARPVRRKYGAASLGNFAGPPIRKPVVGVGRHASRCYCATCGQKRGTCRCGATS